MKPSFRFYTHDRVARFTYTDRVLVLKKHDQFQLEEFKGRPVVVKDGLRYPIAPAMVKELVKRSTVADADADYVNSVKDFDKLGYKIKDYLTVQAKKLTKEVTDSGFKNEVVWVKFAYRLLAGEVVCALVVRPTQLRASIYSPLPLDIRSVEIYEQLQRAIRRLAAHLSKEGHTVSKFSTSVVHASNVLTPWGHFSGTIYSTAAKLS